LVIISMPPSSHAALCVKALEAGAHVLCEKPLVGTLADMDRITAAEARTGRTCTSVFQWRFGSAAQHVKRLIQQGSFGRSLVGICQTTWYRNQAYYEVPWRGEWDTELGGVTMGHGIHAMDLFLWLFGEWAEVSAVMGTLDRRMEVEDVSLAHVRFKDGGLGSVINSVLSPREVSYLRMDFQKVTIELTHLYRYTNADWRFTLPSGAAYADELVSWECIPGDVASDHSAQLAAVLDALERGDAPLTRGDEVRRTVEFQTSLYKSALTGQPVAHGSIVPGDPFYERPNGRVD
jgi:predicted dehydrogenase